VPGVLNRLAAGESPDVGIEAAEFLLHLKESLRVLNGRRDLEPVPHDL